MSTIVLSLKFGGNANSGANYSAVESELGGSGGPSGRRGGSCGKTYKHSRTSKKHDGRLLDYSKHVSVFKITSQ